MLGVFDTIGALVDLPCFGRPARLRGASIDDPDRIGEPVAVGLDETPYVRDGPFRVQRWSTQIVDVTCGRLLDVVAGRDSVEPCAWFARPHRRVAGSDPLGPSAGGRVRSLLYAGQPNWDLLRTSTPR